jgi:hypothetical protein
VATEEAFEIVRRRLFEPVRDAKGRESVCRAFADAYVAEGVKLPSETQEGRYYDRLLQAYPIHPEVFDRLYEDWTTIDGFQRTRGVPKLMAKIIYRLWKGFVSAPSRLVYDGPHPRWWPTRTSSGASSAFRDFGGRQPPGEGIMSWIDLNSAKAATATRVAHSTAA